MGGEGWGRSPQRPVRSRLSGWRFLATGRGQSHGHFCCDGLCRRAACTGERLRIGLGVVARSVMWLSMGTTGSAGDSSRVSPFPTRLCKQSASELVTWQGRAAITYYSLLQSPYGDEAVVQSMEKASSMLRDLGGCFSSRSAILIHHFNCLTS